MESLRIEWKTGYMVLNVRAFFPTTDKQSRKIAKLINQYCPKETVEELIQELRSMAEKLHIEAEECKDSIPKAITKGHVERLKKQIRMNEARRKRLLRDSKNIEGGMS